MMSVLNPMGMGARIKERRKELGLSVAAVAKLAGLRPTTLYDIEREDQQATTRLHALCQVLGLDPTWVESGRGHRLTTEPARKQDQQARWTLHGMQISTDEVEVGIAWGQLEEPARTMIREHIEMLMRRQRREHRAELEERREHSLEPTRKPR